MTQNAINLTPLANIDQIVISAEKYKQLISIKKDGWSNCQSTEEWLAKIHYLKEGLKDKKINAVDFEVRTKRLVLTWWAKGM